MSTATTTYDASPMTTPTASTTKRHPVRRATLASGALAAVAVTAVAGTAHAAGVPFEIDGESIPVLGFAQMTLVGAVLGGLLAATLHRYSSRARSWFVGTAVVLTALSCIPSIALPPDAASKLVLVATHVLAAAVVVPALARQLAR